MQVTISAEQLHFWGSVLQVVSVPLLGLVGRWVIQSWKADTEKICDKRIEIASKSIAEKLDQHAKSDEKAFERLDQKLDRLILSRGGS